MQSRAPTSTAIVIGSGGGIGAAMCEQWKNDTRIDQLITVSRQAEKTAQLTAESGTDSLVCDYSEESISKNGELISKMAGTITRVCICNGILHNENIWPEKRIEDINSDALQQVFTANSIVPLLWLKALLPVVKSQTECIITVLSARIGSIGDNRSGGWYSYRASKAALNMLLKTASIEFSRRARNVKLIAFQPGTTDTNLSKPFQASVRAENLLTPEFVASHLVNIMDHQSVDGELSFIDWENQSIDW